MRGSLLPRQALLALAVAAAYYLAACLGVVLRFPPATTSVLWPPNSLLTATFLLTPPRHWWLYLAAVFPAHVLAEVQAGFPVSMVLALFATNCSEALLAAGLLHRWSEAPARFDSLRQVTLFLVSAVGLAPFLSSFADAAVVHWLGGEPYGPVFLRRLYSNALSALTIVPSVVTLASQGARWLRDSSPRRRLEAAALAGVLVAVGLAVFSSHPGDPDSLPGAPYTSLPFLVPVLMWAAVRFGPAGGSLALLATSLLAIRAATLGWKPFSPLSPEEGVVALQVFVTVVGVPLLYLSALIQERRQATAALGERLRFEELFSRLSAEFVHLASRQMDRAFETGLQQLGEFFEVDRVTLRRLSGNGTELNVAYTWTGPRCNPTPALLERADVPWGADRLLREEPLVVPNVDDLPAEAALERDLFQRHGVRSLLVVPLVAGKQVLGGLGFVGATARKAWPGITVERTRLLADLFAGALARKQAEDAMRASEATKTAILASLTSHVAVLDQAGHVAIVNESWSRLALGESEADRQAFPGVGSDYLDFWRRLARGCVGEAGTAVSGLTGVLLGTRQTFVLEYPCPAHPGSWYVMTVVPLRAPEGGAVVSLTEVTERKRAELEAQKSRQELAHFLRVSTIGELTTSLAHELNQPLTAILANAQAATRLVHEPTPVLEPIREILADVAEEALRAGEVIRRLRELLRKGEPQRARLDVNALVREVVELLATDAMMRGVAVRLDLHPEPLAVWGDRVQLQQVLLNILINAMEAIADGAGTDPLVLVHTESAGYGGARVSVADNGHGLRNTGPGGVFAPFYTTKPHGLGMGLSIARSIAEAHGGDIEASNNANRGATFTVTLPAADPEASPMSRSAPGAARRPE